MKTRMTNVLLGIAISLMIESYGEAAVWITLDYPGATVTYAMGIDGKCIVGGYSDGSRNHGFMYDGTTWTPLDYPGAIHTEAWGIDGDKIVGLYNDGKQRGFLYDGATWIPLDYPGASSTAVTGIDGGNVVGEYIRSGRHGFLYDGTTWTTLDYPGGSQTSLRGIDGSDIVGTYGFYRGILYDGTTWITLDYPGSPRTAPGGVDDGNIVGSYDDAHGFIYDGETWTTLDFPDSTATAPYDIDGRNIVGRYFDLSGKQHGFLYIDTIDAVVDIKPDTLELSSTGKWVTCYIIPADDYKASDIVVSTIRLEDLLEVQHSELQNGVLMVKFDRQELIEYIRYILEIHPPDPCVPLMVTGKFTDGARFEGIDEIRVID